MADTNWTQLLLVGGGIYAFVQGSNGKLPPSLQSIYDGLFGGAGSPSAPAPGSPPSAPGGKCSFDSTTLSIPAKYGPLWCSTHPQPPQSVQELDDWGNNAGYRINGVWAN